MTSPSGEWSVPAVERRTGGRRHDIDAVVIRVLVGDEQRDRPRRVDGGVVEAQAPGGECLHAAPNGSTSTLCSPLIRNADWPYQRICMRSLSSSWRRVAAAAAPVAGGRLAVRAAHPPLRAAARPRAAERPAAWRQGRAGRRAARCRCRRQAPGSTSAVASISGPNDQNSSARSARPKSSRRRPWARARSRICSNSRAHLLARALDAGRCPAASAGTRP